MASLAARSTARAGAVRPARSSARRAVRVAATSRVDQYSKNDIIVSPSILSADFAKLGDEVRPPRATRAGRALEPAMRHAAVRQRAPSRREAPHRNAHWLSLLRAIAAAPGAGPRPEGLAAAMLQPGRAAERHGPPPRRRAAALGAAAAAALSGCPALRRSMQPEAAPAACCVHRSRPSMRRAPSGCTSTSWTAGACRRARRRHSGMRFAIPPPAAACCAALRRRLAGAGACYARLRSERPLTATLVLLLRCVSLRQVCAQHHHRPAGG